MGKSIAIIGAGLSGLSAAYHLCKAGHCVTLLESSDRVGGAVRTTHEDGYLAEHGPNSLLLGDARVKNLIEDIGLNDQLVVANPAANKRYVVHNGVPKALPSSPLSGATSSLFSLGAKLRVMREPFIGKGGRRDESFADFVRRRLGPEMLERAAGPFVSGIYAGDPEQLSARHAFPRLWALEEKYGSFIKGALQLKKLAKNGQGDPNRLAKRELIGFRDGMQALPDALAAALPDGVLWTNVKYTGPARFNGKTWSLSWENDRGSTGMGAFDHFIIATPHHALENAPIEEEIVAELGPVIGMQSPPVASLVVGFSKEQVTHPLDGFGMLMGMKENAKILGALFSSTIFPGRAPDGKVAITAMLGGARTPDHVRGAEKELVPRAVDELRRLLGVKGKPEYVHTTIWPKAIPQYNAGYGRVLEALEKCEEAHPGLHFIGNYRGGVSVGDCLLNGLKLSEELSR